MIPDHSIVVQIGDGIDQPLPTAIDDPCEGSSSTSSNIQSSSNTSSSIISTSYKEKEVVLLIDVSINRQWIAFVTEIVGENGQQIKVTLTIRNYHEAGINEEEKINGSELKREDIQFDKKDYKFLSISSNGDWVAISSVPSTLDVLPSVTYTDNTIYVISDEIIPSNDKACMVYQRNDNTAQGLVWKKKLPIVGRAVFLKDSRLAIFSSDSVIIYNKDTYEELHQIMFDTLNIDEYYTLSDFTSSSWCLKPDKELEIPVVEHMEIDVHSHFWKLFGTLEKNFDIAYYKKPFKQVICDFLEEYIDTEPMFEFVLFRGPLETLNDPKFLEDLNECARILMIKGRRQFIFKTLFCSRLVQQDIIQTFSKVHDQDKDIRKMYSFAQKPITQLWSLTDNNALLCYFSSNRNSREKLYVISGLKDKFACFDHVDQVLTVYTTKESLKLQQMKPRFDLLVGDKGNTFEVADIQFHGEDIIAMAAVTKDNEGKPIQITFESWNISFGVSLYYVTEKQKFLASQKIVGPLLFVKPIRKVEAISLKDAYGQEIEHKAGSINTVNEDQNVPSNASTSTEQDYLYMHTTNKVRNAVYGCYQNPLSTKFYSTDLDFENSFEKPNMTSFNEWNSTNEVDTPWYELDKSVDLYFESTNLKKSLFGMENPTCYVRKIEDKPYLLRRGKHLVQIWRLSSGIAGNSLEYINYFKKHFVDNYSIIFKPEFDITELIFLGSDEYDEDDMYLKTRSLFDEYEYSGKTLRDQNDPESRYNHQKFSGACTSLRRYTKIRVFENKMEEVMLYTITFFEIFSNLL